MLACCSLGPVPVTRPHHRAGDVCEASLGCSSYAGGSGTPGRGSDRRACSGSGGGGSGALDSPSSPPPSELRLGSPDGLLLPLLRP